MRAGKGDRPRPVDKKKFDENFDAIFGPRKPWVRKGKIGCCNTCTCKKNKKTS